MTAKKSVLAVLGLLAATLAFVGAGCGGGDGGSTLKIVSDLPLQGSDREQTAQMNLAIQEVLAQADNKAGDYTIEFEEFDDSTAAAGKWDEAKCAENGNTYADDSSIVGVIGTYNSGCAAIIIPILNEVGVAMVSPANTYTGLTVSGPGTESGEPDKYYPTGTRNYTRVVANDSFQGRIDASYMKDDLGVTKVYILDDRELYGKGVADVFESSAKEIGLEVVGHDGLGQGRSQLHGSDDADQVDGRRRHLHGRRLDEQRRPAHQGQGRDSRGQRGGQADGSRRLHPLDALRGGRARERQRSLGLGADEATERAHRRG